MNEYFDGKFRKREKTFRRNYDIEDDLYTKLEELSKYYAASVAELVNSSLQHLIETEDIVLYEKDKNKLLIKHTMLIWESNILGLEKLNEKYGVSIYKLVNIAIRNVLEGK